jgi:hypothetical protein
MTRGINIYLHHTTGGFSGNSSDVGFRMGRSPNAHYVVICGSTGVPDSYVVTALDGHPRVITDSNIVTARQINPKGIVSDGRIPITVRVPTACLYSHASVRESGAVAIKRICPCGRVMMAEVII